MEKKLLRNIASLAAVQGSNYLIPLITLPYLVKTLSPYSYGLFGFSLALIQYFNIIVNYGFNLSATQKIALSYDNKNEISKIFWSVITCQIILALASIVIVVVGIMTIDFLKEQSLIILSCLGILLGNVLFPVWLFQGKESMSLSSFANISSRLLSVPLVFIFVNSTADAWIAALIMSLTTIMGGVISILLLIRKKWIFWQPVSFADVILQFKDGWYLFLSTAAISIYTSSITVLLGFICGPVVVGYFVAADKLRLAAQGLIIPVSQACYPRVISLLSKNKNEGIKFIQKMLLLQGGLGLIISLGIYLFSNFIIEFLYGNEYLASVSVLKILSLCPLLISLSNVLGIQTLTALGYKKQFFNILLTVSTVCMLAMFPLSKLLSEQGAAITIVLSEFLVTLLMAIFIHKKNILNKKIKPESKKGI